MVLEPKKNTEQGTGCFRMTEKKFELSTHSRMPYMSCKVWHFSRETGTFEYYVSKNYNT